MDINNILMHYVEHSNIRCIFNATNPTQLYSWSFCFRIHLNKKKSYMAANKSIKGLNIQIEFNELWLAVLLFCQSEFIVRAVCCEFAIEYDP